MNVEFDTICHGGGEGIVILTQIFGTTPEGNPGLVYVAKVKIAGLGSLAVQRIGLF